MSKFDFLPAYPLITIDPYLSIWSASDHPADTDTTHWTGARKPLYITTSVDGKEFALVGRCGFPKAELVSRTVTPLKTEYRFSAGGACITVSFRALFLPDDFDLMSTPVTPVEFTCVSEDENEHTVLLKLSWTEAILKDEDKPISIVGSCDQVRDLQIAWMGNTRQNMLCHSGDHITIDWGYAYMAAENGVSFARNGATYALAFDAILLASKKPVTTTVFLAYDDVASIQYFDYTAKAWYARNGKTLTACLHEISASYAELVKKLDAFDTAMIEEARTAGGETMVRLACAAYRHSVCAHKLIADRDGNPVFLSKENDSNGCIGTVDVSYPSIPLYLMYAPELVRAMCRGVLKFASLPVWRYDFAPHDIGRYPYATGQVYGLDESAVFDTEICNGRIRGDVIPPLYLYEGEKNIYTHQYQMPVEECGNMLLMLAASMKADGNSGLVREYLPTLKTWVKYLETYGGDPGEQLCTDDFAGHLARNVNLAFKAICGLAAYGWMMNELGEKDEGEKYMAKAKEMAASVCEKAETGKGTALTLDGKGWSLKYNTVWDRLFGFGLFPESFYKNEIERYKQETNRFGVPLDSRRTYTKSDWYVWTAAMLDDAEEIDSYLKPLLTYMKDTPTRVPLSDWYDTVSGRYEAFIARSVQGGLFMPMLKKRWIG